MYNGYLPSEMLEKEFRWECVNYALYNHLKDSNKEQTLNNRLEELLKRQESQLIMLQEMSVGQGTYLRNYPSYYAPSTDTAQSLSELLKRENELLLEYKSYRNYFLPPTRNPVLHLNELISNKRKQIELLNELTQCFQINQVDDTRQEYFLEEGYRLEKVVGGLTFPTVITFDDQNNLYIVEAGYAYGAEPGEGRILKLDMNGETKEIASGFSGPVTGLTWYEGNFYVAEGATGKKANLGCGKITKVSPDGKKEVIVNNLRSCGDHFTGDVKIGPDNMLYFTVGTATNSGVVGPDNASWVQKNPQFHDRPARDFVLTGKNFLSSNPFNNTEGNTVETGAFKPFGESSKEGEVIKGDLYANGVIYRCNIDGSNLQVYADGFRNPFGLTFSPFNRKMYVTDNGADHRGSRPINHDWDNFWEVTENGWHGWPDFYSGLPATQPHFQAEGKPKPGFVIKNHPKLASQPIVRFEPHTSSNKFSFSTNSNFDFVGEAFVGQLGGMGGEHGMKVVRVNIETGQIRDFYINRKGLDIKEGPKRPVAAIFNGEGDTLYVVDFGLMGPREKSAGTGALWKIVKQ